MASLDSAKKNSSAESHQSQFSYLWNQPSFTALEQQKNAQLNNLLQNATSDKSLINHQKCTSLKFSVFGYIWKPLLIY